MIQTLASGWVASEDLADIERVCRTVRTSQANAARTSLDPLSLTDIGQRTRLRIAFANMP